MNETSSLTYDDLWSFKEMGSIALSPDGKRVAFGLNTLDQEKNERRGAIYLLHLDEQGRAVGEARQLTGGAKNDANPVWAPDSRRLLFLSNREDDTNQLWLIDSDGGEAHKLTSMSRGVSEAAWSPDGKWIAFIGMAAPGDDEDVLMGRTRLDADAKKKREEEERLHLRTVTKMWYRLDGRGLFMTNSQLFVMPAPGLEGALPATPDVRRLTADDSDYIQPSWTPDGAAIGVLRQREDDSSWVSDLWTIQQQSGDALRLTNSTLQIESYAWSPDGQWAMAVAEQDFQLEGTSNSNLYLVARDGSGQHKLTAHLDNPTTAAVGTGGCGRPGPYQPQWSEDGRRVYFLYTEHGRVNVHCMDVAQRAVTPLTHGECVTYYLGLLPGERGLALAQAYPLHPWELYLLPLQDGIPADPVRLTHIYDALLERFSWGEPERVVYRGANDEEIDGWLLQPRGAHEGVRYPLIVTIHGGPQFAYGVGMSLFFQYLAGQGYAVFYCNPHGSTGYGQTFLREVEGDWGGWDYQDIMLGVDACIERGVADPERLLVTGYSYGGYMSMFIIGQTGRFKAAVPMAGVSNLASFVGTSDLGFWQATQAKGYPWEPERQAYYRERSPLTHAANVTTPTLFIHPENDLRCPIEQSEQFYMTLKMMGKVPVALARGPASWHIGTEKPSQYFERWESMLEWFRQYVEIRPGEYE